MIGSAATPTLVSMSSPQSRAVLWDMDGVLVDSADYHYQAWRTAMHQEGRDLTREQFQRTFGQRNDTVLRDMISPDISDADIQRIASRTAEAFGCTAEVDYRRGYPPTINSKKEAEFACSVAAKHGASVVGDMPPIMGSEDFSFMLQAKPGCFMFIGNGDGPDGGCMVHNPNYDFNDAILPAGVRYWVELVRSALPSG